MESLRKDILYGFRMLWKNPGFTLVAVITLALGIGANTAIFSVVDAILLRPLPVREPDQLTVLAFQQKHGNVEAQFSIADYRDLRDQSASAFNGVIAYQMGMDGFSINGKADRVVTNYVSGNYFSVLGLKPALGRLILPTEGEVAGADPVVVLGYKYWMGRFGGDPSVVGRKISIDGHPSTIVGVAPKGFYGAQAIIEAQAFLPMGQLINAGQPPDFMTNRGLRALGVFARLKPGMSLQSAQASLAPIAKEWGDRYPETNKDMQLQVYLEQRSRPEPDPNNTMMIISGLFLALAVMVLLLACLNVANILLVRATVREKEMAIRAALGAARIRLVRQLLTESILLALAGGAAGIVLGSIAGSAISSININTDLPILLDFGVDWRVFSYAFGAALITGIIVGIVPALRISRGNINPVLHSSGRGVVGAGQRLRTALVVAQVAGSLTLLIIAGLFVRSLAAAQRTNLGFDPNHVLDMSMDPVEIGYNPAQSRDFYKNLLTRVRALPGVESATSAASTPMGYYNNGDDLVIEGFDSPAGQPKPAAGYNIVGTDYFKTLRMTILRGRDFTEADDLNAPYVAIVNEVLVQKYWPNQDPIGRHFRMASDLKHTLTIVGVAANSRQNGLTGDYRRFFYIPFSQHADLATLQTLQVRTAGDPVSMIPTVRGIVQSLAPDLPVFDAKSLRDALITLNGLLTYQLGAGFAGALGMLGLALSVVGVYGVISYSAAQRRQEIGIRMALGAQPGQILMMVLRQGVIIVAAGVAIGLTIAFACARVASGLLAVKATDPVTYISAAAVLALVALLASYIPARRTMRVDPMIALRYE